MRFFVALVVAILVLAACGGDEESADTTTSSVPTTTTSSVPATTTTTATPSTTTTTTPAATTSRSTDEQALVDAIVEFGLADPENELSPEDTTCVAETVVDVVGLDALGAGGITLDQPDLDASDFQPTREQADVFTDRLFECMDLGDALVSSLLTDEEAPEFLTEEAARCLGDGMEGSEVFRNFLAESLFAGDDQDNPFADDPETAPLLVDLMFDCVDFGDVFLESFSAEAEISDESAR